MNAATVLAVIALAVILFFAARYIYKEKKKGAHCIGCPMAGSCPRKNLGCKNGEYHNGNNGTL